ncbi:hypothetical protein QBC46DRAFT_352786 [Diplogelasinospora grovesii]|uniref:Uncharacterized protein n=1 Tax=Diplogelasinospora grovesii TaxID=303347 RepID=A0AAN6NBD4_9PEZI|nr:hypothetical protein QBC46DRAFT_352786 [Diplogelasinospora grovesii]
MAPTYRAGAAQTRRGNRSGFPEHDDFEGLPVRQWRHEWVNIAPPPTVEATQQNDRWTIELPYGLPKDYPLLAPHSQELLRAARSGGLYKRPTPAEGEDLDADAENPDGKGSGEKKDGGELGGPTAGFMIKMWKQLPRNVEMPIVSRLAKRHKNTVTLAPRAAAAAPPGMTGATVTRATVRRIDAAGNPYEQTITLTDGQRVDGEIISTTVVSVPVAANGLVGSGMGAHGLQATPVRRRPPPPKRKAKGLKGPGRGRKKAKLPLPLPLPATNQPLSTQQPGGGGVVGGHGVAATAGTADQNPAGAADAGANAKHGDGEDSANQDSANQDSEVADNSAMQSDDEEGDEGEGEGDDDDEEEGEAMDQGDNETPGAENYNDQDEGVDAEMAESESLEAIRPSSVEEPTEYQRRDPSSEEDYTIYKARTSHSPAGLGPPHLGLHLASSPRIEGSPLKNVIIQSPTDPSPMASPGLASASASASAQGYVDTYGGSTRSVTMEIESSGHAPSQVQITATTTATTVESSTAQYNAQVDRPEGSISMPGSASSAVSRSQAPPALLPEHLNSRPTLTGTGQAIGQQASPAAAHSDPLSTIEPSEARSIPDHGAVQAPGATDPPTRPSFHVTPPQPEEAVMTTLETEDDGPMDMLSSLEHELDRQERLSRDIEATATPTTSTATPGISDAPGASIEGSTDASLAATQNT